MIMTTTDTTIDARQIAATATEVEQRTRDAEDAARTRLAEADQARAAADEAATAAQAEIEDVKRSGGRVILSQLRELTAEVWDARKAAEDAVRDGGDAPFEAWLAYRRLRATSRGRWRALSAEYERIVGRTPPAGSWGPDVHDPGRPGAEESFDRFVAQAMSKVERELHREAQQQTQRELFAARDAAR